MFCWDALTALPAIRDFPSMNYQVGCGSFMVVARGPAEAIDLHRRLRLSELNTRVVISDADGNEIEIDELRGVIEPKR